MYLIESIAGNWQQERQLIEAERHPETLADLPVDEQQWVAGHFQWDRPLTDEEIEADHRQWLQQATEVF